MNPIQHNKVFLFIVILVAIFFSCEGRYHYPQSLTVADSLADHNPDSAINFLKKLSPLMSDAPEDDRMYYQLLCIKAADKAYIPHTTDSLIRPVIDYYEQGGDPQLIPVAYYYGGRVNMDLGDAPQATEFYRKSLDAMPSDSCSPLRGKVLHQLGRLYWDQHVNQEALSYYQAAFENDISLKDTVGAIFNMEAIAGVYEDKSMPDSALFYYQSAYHLTEQCQDSILQSDICTQLARFYVSIGRVDQAKPYMLFSLRHLDVYDLNAVYGVASKYYMATHQIDSAIYYSQLKLARPNIFSKEGACRQLTDLFIQKGDLKKANEYIILYKQYNDSARGRLAAEEVARVNALYNQHINEQKILRLKLHDAKKTKWIVIIISIFVLFTFFVYRVIRFNQLRLEKAKEREASIKRILAKLSLESNEQKEIYLERIKTLNQQINELQSQKNILYNDGEKEMKRLAELEEEQNNLKSYVKVAEAAKQRQDDYRCIIRDTDIFHLLMELLKHGKHPTNMEWHQIEETVLGLFPHFKHELLKYVKLSVFEYHVCLLIKMTLTPSQIKYLTLKSKESITSTRRRLYEKAFGKKGKPADWDLFILNIL